MLDLKMHFDLYGINNNVGLRCMYDSYTVDMGPVN